MDAEFTTRLRLPSTAEAAAANERHDRRTSGKGKAFTHDVRVPEHDCTTKEPVAHFPDLPSTAVNDRLCTPSLDDRVELPSGHTYQPYFWISHLAHRQSDPGDTECAMVKSQIIDELSMSENKARQAFDRRFEYRCVDEGLGFLFKDKPINQTGPVKKIGVFAKAPVEELSFLGIYSGVMYSLTTKLASVERDTGELYTELKQQTPDMMSHPGWCQPCLLPALKGI